MSVCVRVYESVCTYVWFYDHMCVCVYMHIHMFLVVYLCKDQFKFYTLRLSTFLESEDILTGLHFFKGLFEGKTWF